MSYFEQNGTFRLISSKSTDVVSALPELLYNELRYKFPQIYANKGKSINFQGSKFPILMIWNLFDAISKGEIKIEELGRSIIISYKIDFSRYVIANTLLIFLMTVFMYFSETPIEMIIIGAPIFWTILAIGIPFAAMIKFISFIEKSIAKVGGEIRKPV